MPIRVRSRMASGPRMTRSLTESSASGRGSKKIVAMSVRPGPWARRSRIVLPNVKKAGEKSSKNRIRKVLSVSNASESRIALENWGAKPEPRSFGTTLKKNRPPVT